MRESTLLVTPSSPTLRKLLSNLEKKASARFFAMQPMFFVFILLLSLLFSPFFLKKKVRPAVKWCNPDAVTMLLSVNHQRHHLFFKGKKVGAFDELKVFLICRGI